MVSSEFNDATASQEVDDQAESENGQMNENHIRERVKQDYDVQTTDDKDHSDRHYEINQKSTEEYSYSQTDPLKLFTLIKYYIKQAYIVVWHDLSMDPAVRISPYEEPPKNEVQLPFREKLETRAIRLGLIGVHLLSLIGLYHVLTFNVKFFTILWTIVLTNFGLIGISAGSHRLWSHRAYRATWQLRTILMIFHTMAVQYSIFYWAQTHRVHHKFTDTVDDPHNSNNGIVFTHIGWLVKLPNQQVRENMKKINLLDIRKDKVVMFQRKFYIPLVLILGYLIPTLVPWYFWGEDWIISNLTAGAIRFVYTFNAFCLINSFGHRWGMKPYNKSINPTDNTFISFIISGEGWHNYHHVFPWDYRNSDIWEYKVNTSTAFIDLFAKIGWAYDMKAASADLVHKKMSTIGDGTKHKNGWLGWAYDLQTSRTDETAKDNVRGIWGWDDPNLSQEDRELAEIQNKR